MTAQQTTRYAANARALKVSLLHYTKAKLNERNKKWADAFQLRKPEDIALLPWAGNHAWDMFLFERVEHYVKQELKDKAQQKKALDLMSLHGMGIESNCTDEQLADYLNNVY